MTTGRSRRKLAKLIEQYELTEMDDRLRFKYEVDGDSLRSLAHFVNTEITKARLGDSPFSPEHVYRTLRDPDDTASKSDQSDLRRRLRLNDVDVESLERDWVSHMSVRSYLQKDLDIDTERETKGPLDPAETLDRIRGLREREENIIWENLRATEGVDGSKWDLHQDLRLINKETGESVRVEELLRKLETGAE